MALYVCYHLYARVLQTADKFGGKRKDLSAKVKSMRLDGLDIFSSAKKITPERNSNVVVEPERLDA